MMLETLTQCASVTAALCVLTVAPFAASSATAGEVSLEQDTSALAREEDTTSVYEKAKTELPENLYVLYRIVDRLARANDLDDYPWRVTIAENDEIDAYATEANVIVIASGLLDRMAGDASSLACVVGHEMTHHMKQHAAIFTSQIAEWQEQLGEEEEDYLQLEEQSAELRRMQELEADAWGYRYAAAAGFDAVGCLRGFEILSRLPDSLRDSSSHPAVPKRIEALETLMVAEPPAKLAINGQALVTTSSPLTYELVETESERWLRINSERGGSFVTDLERLFPQ